MIDKNKIFKCQVLQIKPTFAIVNYHGNTGICHISEISDYHITDIHKFLTVGETYDFLLIDADEVNHKYKFSFKRLRPKLIKHHSAIIDSLEGFDNLLKNTLELARK
ncbi:MAG: S1 RNA-binding domain-containing protein [Mycoplasmataceae bacterium]|nr:S1 RNA-binding domain-containing protein [Mycoplasmataceae bacterium]